MNQSEVCYELYPLPPTAERYGHVGDGAGEPGKGTTLEKAGMKIPAEKRVRDPQEAKQKKTR